MKSPIKKLTNFFEEFLSLFEEEESVPEFEVPEKWRKKRPKSKTNSIPTKQTGKLVLKSSSSAPPTKQTGKLILKTPVPTSLPQKYKIKIPYLRKTKKYLAAILLLINGGIGVLSLGFQPALSLIFLGNAFILLDYLWKIRKKAT